MNKSTRSYHLFLEVDLFYALPALYSDAWFHEVHIYIHTYVMNSRSFCIFQKCQKKKNLKNCTLVSLTKYVLVSKKRFG